MLRLFGGVCYTEIKGFSGWVTRWVVHHTDLHLAQTKALVASARGNGVRHVHWYPTSRPMNDAVPRLNTGRPCRRFISVGWVNKSKGIPEIIEAAEKFPADVHVDVYGPFSEGLDESTFAGCQRVTYCGIIPAGQTMQRMHDYDALLLPTYWEGEGYHGVIMEAYGAGIPVITTTWRSLPELVDDTCGILIEPHNSQALSGAMQRLVEDRELYSRLAQGARAKACQFSAEEWTKRLVSLCRQLVLTKNL